MCKADDATRLLRAVRPQARRRLRRTAPSLPRLAPERAGTTRQCPRHRAGIATLPARMRTTGRHAGRAPEDLVKRTVVLYLATLIVLIPVDFLFLGLIAKGFFASQVGDMLGEIRPLPAVLFYLLYVAGILIFVSASASARWQTTLLYGALFGFFCY